jgi:hypothetical protein
MPLTHPKGPPPRSRDLSPPPLFTIEGDNIPRHSCRPGSFRRTSPAAPETAYASSAASMS